MHYAAAQYNYPAPIMSGRMESTLPMIPGGHYATYDPRTSHTTSSTVVNGTPPQPPTTTITAPTTTATASTTATHSRSSSRTSSEFRGSTNPSEDWTKISDLAERRRIQNRIAQRNYRKKLKRRLEDLERRAQSRSLSPNGDDSAEGRSPRELSSENQNCSTSRKTTPPATASGDTITVSTHVHPGTSSYDYPSSYSTTTSTTSSLYPSQYRTASTYSSAASPPTNYATTTNTYDQPTNQYAYSPYDSHHHHHHSSHLPPPHQSYHNTPDSAVDPNLHLSLPSLTHSSSANTSPASSTASSPAQRSIPSTTMMGLKSQSLYELENNGHSPANSMSPYILSGSYDSVQDQYHYSPAGVSSTFYNLDYSSPSLPPLMGHHGGSSVSNSSNSSSGRYIKKESVW